jgi:hypothetical protein
LAYSKFNVTKHGRLIRSMIVGRRGRIYMRNALAFVLVFLVPAWATAAAQEKFYFLGEVKLSSATGKSMGSQVILVEKTHDPDNNLIIERAIVVQPDGKAEEYTMRLAVKEDNTFTLSDDAKFVEGNGKLFGPAWKWTYFKATFKSKNGVRIEDENFMSDESVGTARKKVIGPDDKVLMYMDMSLEGITPKTFDILRTGLIKK